MKEVGKQLFVRFQITRTLIWKRNACLFTLLTLWLLNSSAQAILDFQNFTQKAGLSSDFVLSIHQDHAGFIWIGTEGGLSRFDGEHFLDFSFDPEDPQTLGDDWVTSIYEDSRNNLWVGTQKGLNRLNRATGKIERIPVYKTDQEVEGELRDICEDTEGRLWVNFYNQGLFELKRDPKNNGKWYTEYFETVDSLFKTENRPVQGTLLFATPNELWFCDNKAIKQLHLSSRKLTYYNLSNIEAPIAEELQILSSKYMDDGNIFLYTQKKLFVLDTKAESPQIKPLRSIDLQLIEDDRFTADFPRSFLQDSEDVLLIGWNYRNLFFLNFRTGELELIRRQNQTAQNLFPNLIRLTYKDRQGNYWIGTTGSGVYLGRKLDPPFVFYQNDPEDPHSVSSGQVRTFLEDGRGNLWIGVLNHGLDQFVFEENYRLQKKRSLVPIPDQPNAFASNRIVEIILGPEKSIWMATLTHGVVRVDSTGQRFTYINQQLGDSTFSIENRIWALEKDQQDYIWAGTWSGGLLRIDPSTGSIQRFRHNPSDTNSLLNNNIRYLYTNKQGILWIGTEGGLCKYDPKTQQFTPYSQDPNDPRSLSDNLVWAIYQDQNNDLWVGTNTGLNRLNEQNGEFEHFYKKNGLPDNTIYGILEDDEGVLWVSTEKGLARQLPPGSDAAFFPLGLADGLATISFIPKAYLNSSISEHLFFGSTDGFIRVKPSLMQLETPQPQLTIHSLSTFNPYKKGGELLTDYFVNDRKETIKLGYQDQSITITLSDLNWKNNTGLRYDYQLVGFNDQWRPLDEDMQITLTNLAPGRYGLQARARNAENISSEPKELLRFRVYPPWWKSVWAYFFYVLFTGSVIFSIYRFQLRRQIEKQEAQNFKALDTLKSKLYTNITHEFRTPLTIISGMLDQIEKNPRIWLKKGTAMIRKNTTNLLNLINQMLELRKLESGNLKAQLHLGDIIPFLHILFKQFQAFAQSKNQEINMISDLDALQMDFDSEKTLGIVSNLLSNAIKYTPEKGKIIFKISTGTRAGLLPSQCLILSVKDDGPGIPSDQLPYIFNRFYQANVNTSKGGTGIGLSLTQELVKLLNGTIEVSSKEGKGTTFRVYLPITQEAAPSINVDQMAIPEKVFGLTGPIEKKQIASTDLPIALIVEDSRDIADYLQICLEGYYQLVFASNGQDGIDKACENIPDIIVSDVMMPEKNGYELCEVLKEDIRTSHIPIILLTAKSDVESRIVGLKQGADDYLGKPFNEEELLIRMQNLLEIRRKLQVRYQNIYDQPLPKAKVTTPNIEDEFILEIKEIFEERMNDLKFDLESLCQELNLSRSNLYRKINALTGRSPAIYLRSLRLQKARQLLRSTDLSVKQIAYDVGFSDPSYFSRSYTEEFGESPSSTRAS